MEFIDNFDYYSVLEVSPDASIDDIKKQYRKLALKFHPDKCHDPSQKKIHEDTFKKISKAYSVLSNETERRRYDAVRSSGNLNDLDAEWAEFSFEDALRTFAEFVYTYTPPDEEEHDGVIEIPFTTALTGGLVRAGGRRITVGGILNGEWEPLVEVGHEVYVLRVKFPPTMPQGQVSELERLLVYTQGAAFALKTMLPNLQPYILGERGSSTSKALFWGASAAIIFSGLALGGMSSNTKR